MIKNLLSFCLLFFAIPLVSQTTTFINEVDYTSNPPCIEIVTPEGTDLSNWNVVLYDSNGEVVDENSADGSVQSIQGGAAIIIVDAVISVHENTGIALKDPSGEVVQFISFGQTIMAVDGPADGLTSEDIGTITDPTSLLTSLQLEGSGDEYDDFSWGESTSTCGLPNVGQMIDFSAPVQGLPVELAYFKASKSREGIQIEWKTLTEINSDYFLLEKSNDARNWKVLDHFSSKGDTQEALIYRTLDKIPFAGHNYYRLSQFDLDGTREVFDIISVYSIDPHKGQVSIYPNPGNSDVLNLILPETDSYDDLKVRVIDIHGKTILLPATNSGQLDVGQLESGIYSIQIISEIEIYHLIYIRSEK